MLLDVVVFQVAIQLCQGRHELQFNVHFFLRVPKFDICLREETCGTLAQFPGKLQVYPSRMRTVRRRHRSEVAHLGI